MLTSAKNSFFKFETIAFSERCLSMKFQVNWSILPKVMEGVKSTPIFETQKARGLSEIRVNIFDGKFHLLLVLDS